ncbi:MAG: fasciclin domain-containing protein [Neoaquamicrobium sediminum]|uniref:fasciclin domain-containing protein n=1 Tax=Hyphomicrobiales TaxID=356 RepID=UPI004037D525
MIKKILLAGAAVVAMAASSHAADIVDTASEAGTFTTLIAAVEAADLVDTLKGEGPFTVFAPTDEAFAALPEGTLDDLLLEENRDQLISILTYHVVPGNVASGDLTEGMTAATVEGSEVTFTLEGGPKVNDANITQPDVAADNGVIHVIDTVIMPPM